MLHIMSLTEFEHITEMDRRCLKMANVWITK